MIDNADDGKMVFIALPPPRALGKNLKNMLENALLGEVKNPIDIKETEVNHLSRLLKGGDETIPLPRV